MKITQVLGDRLKGVCTNYNAEPGLGLSCSVKLSAMPSAVDETAFLQCVKLQCSDSPTNQPLVDLDNAYEVNISKGSNLVDTLVNYMAITKQWFF